MDGKNIGMIRFFHITHRIKIAGRNLMAHWRKTWAIVAGIGLGICALTLVGGYYEYNFWGLKQSLVRSQYGHLQIYPQQYRAHRDTEPFRYSLERSAELISLLEQDPDIQSAVPRSRAMGVAVGPVASKAVEIWGVDPERESELFTFFSARRGTGLGRDDYGCQMSPLLAESLGLALNDTITLTGVREDGRVNMVEVTVQILIASYAEEFNRLAVFVPAAVFADLFGTDAIHEIALVCADDRDLASRRDRLQARLWEGGWETDISLWSEQAVYYHQVVTYYQGFYRLVLAAAALVVFFAVGTAMSLILYERRREFGIYLSMGTGRRFLISGIFTETLMAGIAGLLGGAFLAFASAGFINLAGGIFMPAPPGMSTAIQVLIRFSPQAASLSLVTALLIPPLALIIPLRRIMGQDIVALLDG
ncbi:MAG: FtsX-like permease family protein [Spirochaetaceae bacterium]|jgi:putative ABC transport system permease protein|nr:FtsX-like permease family protein [Spirochaetaceae bacterium]